jgi:hypothetical protein
MVDAAAPRLNLANYPQVRVMLLDQQRGCLLPLPRVARPKRFASTSFSWHRIELVLALMRIRSCQVAQLVSDQTRQGASGESVMLTVVHVPQRVSPVFRRRDGSTTNNQMRSSAILLTRPSHSSLH